jgi:hypothetical protein
VIGIWGTPNWRKYQALFKGRLTWPESDFLVNAQRKLIYSPIAKAGSSSIKQWLLEMLGEHTSEESCMTTMAQRHRLCELPVNVAWRQLEDNQAFKFSFIRNPWTRLVSGYLNKFLKVDRCSIRVAKLMGRCSKELANGELVDITFEEFVQFLARSRPHRFDVHWRPQYLFLRHHRYDFIGRFETFSADFALLQERLSINKPLPHRNSTRYEAVPSESQCVASLTPAQLLDRGGLPSHRQFYTPELRAIVRRIYAADFRMGQYSLQL